MPSDKRDHEQILIVEGSDDKFAVLGLIQHHVVWPNSAPWPVWVECADGVDQILRKGYLSAEIKREKARSIGVLIDADDSVKGRYQRIVQLCGGLFPDLPNDIAEDGVIVTNHEDGKRFGVWIMPDNRSPGGLEAFLQPLVPTHAAGLWDHAAVSFRGALELGCSCTGPDHSKAHLYTWLAWQNPPGQSPGNALKQQALDPRAALALPFVKWFSTLFDVAGVSNTRS